MKPTIARLTSSTDFPALKTAATTEPISAFEIRFQRLGRGFGFGGAGQALFPFTVRVAGSQPIVPMGNR